jgi:hypothetical protein
MQSIPKKIVNMGKPKGKVEMNPRGQKEKLHMDFEPLSCPCTIAPSVMQLCAAAIRQTSASWSGLKHILTARAFHGIRGSDGMRRVVGGVIVSCITSSQYSPAMEALLANGREAPWSCRGRWLGLIWGRRGVGWVGAGVFSWPVVKERGTVLAGLGS